jgi:Protein of unknown function (DUF3047)
MGRATSRWPAVPCPEMALHAPERCGAGAVLRRLTGWVALLPLLAGAQTAPQPLLAPLGELPGWTVAGLPQQRLPRTQFTRVDLDGAPALRVEAVRSYGNLLHRVPAGVSARSLVWRWRVERFAEGADLSRKSGDDTALKVCVMFDLPLERVPFMERQTLRIARAATAEPLPAATLCYVWDPQLPAQTVLPNAYTRRLRWFVLQGQGAVNGRWQTERRDLRADFMRAFGDETNELPPLQAVLVGADTDNAGGHSVAHVAGLELLP